ncbi:proline rich transmembrane protein 1B-like [Triplophysa rosa]|uniref:Proline-rich transmembrane protein 1-like n=1 Tax=Triplophysa rosa TaxID=992332 RepID=A0A9W7TD13_TRIRA|nr:proline rich transmembrane protein 1B-like [Triplophysa rosa]KAI7795042.1 putative proline-rich transmembrane protein 1-like [Triplophysa rosa]
MYNQGPSIGRIEPINIVNRPPIDQNASEKSGIRQFHPPPYQEYPAYPNVRYLPPGSYPAPYGYPAQHYRAPGGPQAPYPSAYHQGHLPGHPGITVQPTVFTTPTPPINPKPDYMCYSVFTLLCCCLPLGVAAVVYSAATRDANSSGQREAAERSSRTALILNNTALGFGITVYAVAILCFFLINANVW